MTLLPIPFFDLTPNVERMAPTSLIGYNPDLGSLMLGFILPFPIVVGAVVSSVLSQTIGNPILYYHGLFPALDQRIAGDPDEHFDSSSTSGCRFNIGVQLAVAVGRFRFRRRDHVPVEVEERPAGRAVRSREDSGRPRRHSDLGRARRLGILATIGFVALNHSLVPAFPIMIIVFYGLVWTPLNSYITARIIGLTGQWAGDVPFLNQAVVLSRRIITKPDIWFAPLPLNNYGGQTQKFRELELTGTKFTSIIKLEFFMLPFILAFSFIYWGFLWYTNDIPSAQFPYTQKLWPQFAVQQSICESD